MMLIMEHHANRQTGVKQYLPATSLAGSNKQQQQTPCRLSSIWMKAKITLSKVQ